MRLGNFRTNPLALYGLTTVVLIEILKILWALPGITYFITHGHFESYRGPFR